MRPARIPGSFSAAALALGLPVLVCGATGPGQAPGAKPAPLQLDSVYVVGSRIPRLEADGPAPVRIYDRETITASGALRVADFLNFLPQNYTGASTGRASAPNDFNPEFGVRSESSAPFVNVALGTADVPLGQSGVAGASLRGLGSGSTLVLVDGRRMPIAAQGNRSTDSRQGFVDLNTIPLGMVERIEVLSDGASALYGSDAVGGVINIVLNKNCTGAELMTDYPGTFGGGASERHAGLTVGFTSPDARLRGMIAVDVYRRAGLVAAQREFSREQDHRSVEVGRAADGTPLFGHDFRLGWGYPAVVQARSGTLNGVSGPNGTPASVALVPDGARTTPTPAQFAASPQAKAAGARQANTAEFLTLVPPQESRGVRGSFDYAVRAGIRGYGGWSASDVSGRFDAQPPVSPAATSSGFGTFSTLVPAMIGGQPNALNPFGQDVSVGLVHVEFGPIRQTTRTRSVGVFAGATGTVAERWTWDAGVNWSRQRFAERNVTLDAAKFTAALAAPDPAQRFNPFVDARAAGAVNAALYPAMTAVATNDGSSELATGTLAVDGPVASLPAGEARVAFGGESALARHRATGRSANGDASGTRAQRHSEAAYVELSTPLVARANARPGMRRLELLLAARYERHGDAGETLDPRAGAVWSPVSWLLVRGACSTGFRAPSLTEYETAWTTTSTTLADPRRTPVATSGVAVRRGSNPIIEPETSRSGFLGLVFKPSPIPGLVLGIDYHRTRQRNVIQQLSPQAIVNNEVLFPGRVKRSAPSEQDAARGQPGAIVGVDTTLINFGAVENRSLDLRLDYEVPGRRAGRLRFGAQASRTLAAETELQPGAKVLELAGDTGAAPRWRWMGNVLWSRGHWSAAGFVSHIGSFTSNHAGNLLAPQGYPSHTVANLHVGYTFEEGLWRGWGRGSRVGVGIDNIADRAPPFSDTVFGFNGGLYSPLGRSYRVSFSVRF